MAVLVPTAQAGRQAGQGPQHHLSVWLALMEPTQAQSYSKVAVAVAVALKLQRTVTRQTPDYMVREVEEAVMRPGQPMVMG